MKTLAAILLTTTSLHAQLVPAQDFPQIQVPEGISVSQFADSSQVINATTLTLDDKGRVYVSETHRWRVQVQDIRHGGKNNRYLRGRVTDDISVMNLASRIEFHKKWSGKEPDYLNWEQFDDDTETIKLLTDTTGDGKADRVDMFRDDFNQPLAGPSSGLIEKDGTVYFAMIPGIYSLRDEDGDGQAEERKTLVDGFGVRVSFSGHDLNGFAFGPDGKLYWSIGDRGYDVEQNGKKFSRPDSGAIFRSNPDGSEFEVFAINLRNPKELVFDEFGNLFTVDNDYDKGDRERVVYAIQHSDSGWKMGHQTIVSFWKDAFNHMVPKPAKKEDHVDMWMNEGLWQPLHDRQPAYIIPPVALSANGPCGFAYNPGVTTLPDRFKNHFFVVSYVANPANTGIYSFTLAQDGAFFKVPKEEWFLKGIALTDLDWGPDGKLYLSDFGGGWTKSGKGGVYALSDPSKINDPAVQEVKALFAQGFPKMESQKLVTLLAHADQRVRQRAQFALAERGTTSLSLFQESLALDQPLMRRLHALWGIGQLAATAPAALDHLAPLLDDPELEIRANAARTLSNHPKLLDPFHPALLNLLNDPSPRVASLAAIALANHGHSDSVQPALSLIAANNDKDVIVRHGGIMILANCAAPEDLADLKNNPNPAVRRAAVVALRRQKSDQVQAFFDDPDTSVRQEAIRAAYDEDIRETYPALTQRAHAIAKRVTPEVKFHPLTARRAMHAAWALAHPEGLTEIIKIINDPTIDNRIRRDALIILLDWNVAPIPDPVTGFVRKLSPGRTPHQGLILKLKPFIKEAPKDLIGYFLKLALQDDLKLEKTDLTTFLNNQNLPDEARLSALELLGQNQRDPLAWTETLRELSNDKNDKVRSKAREILVRLNPDASSIDLLKKILTNKNSTLSEKQSTILALTKIDDPKAKALIKNTLKKLTDKKLDSALALDAVSAAETAKLTDALKAYRSTLPQDDPLAEWKALCETGGDPKKGKTLFYGHATAQCQRCHTMHGVGGDVGPELGAIGKSRDTAHLLRSLITPSSEVTEGYGVGSLTLKDGTTIAGTILTKDKDGNTRLKIGEETKTIPENQIASRTQPLSAMPPMAGLMTKAEVRDVVAFLQSCQEDKTDDGHK